ncbi:MAG: DUF1573 domain-containing protein [Carboxylicivirga sp.]|jgi:hypothetical protein|nr:DUF1573 domain-containing protein [Carboxylicivirga sp.]
MVKYASLGLMLLLVIFGCNTPSKKGEKQKGKGKLEFTELSYNFGKLKHGDVVGHRFMVVNKGKYPVTIQKVKHGCGCTDAVFTKKPINASDTAFVEVIFDTNGWQGRQVKQVVVIANDSIKKHELLVWASINRN